jgi:hypothetical protein
MHHRDELFSALLDPLAQAGVCRPLLCPGSSCVHVQVLKLRHAQEVDKLEQLLVQSEQQRSDAIAKLESQLQYMQVRVPAFLWAGAGPMCPVRRQC